MNGPGRARAASDNERGVAAGASEPWFQRVGQSPVRPPAGAKQKSSVSKDDPHAMSLEPTPVERSLGDEVLPALKKQIRLHEDHIDRVLQKHENRVTDLMTDLMDGQLKQKKEIERLLTNHEVRFLTSVAHIISDQFWQAGLLQQPLPTYEHGDHSFLVSSMVAGADAGAGNHGGATADELLEALRQPTSVQDEGPRGAASCFDQPPGSSSSFKCMIRSPTDKVDETGSLKFGKKPSGSGRLTVTAPAYKKRQVSLQTFEHVTKSQKLERRRPKAKWKAFLNKIKLLTPHAIIHSRQFEMSVAILILFNACVIGAQADWAVQNLGGDPPYAFRALDLFFAVAFSLELAIRLVAEKLFFISLHNPNLNWNVFDALLVISAFIEELFNMVGSDSLDMSAMRVLRIMRLVRVLRVIRVMRVFSDLRKMVTGILSSLKSLLWCLILLFIIMFTVGVCFMQLATEELIVAEANGELNESHEEILFYYGGLVRTIYTLFQAICGGLDWAGAADPLATIHPMMSGLFSVYIAFAVFCVLNIVTGVFVENANKITQQGDDNAILDELKLRELWEDEIQFLFQSADLDNSGELDWEEFYNCLAKDPRIKLYFKKLGLSLEPESVHALFQLLDFDGGGTVDMDEFVEGCTHVHGQARSLDIAKLRHDLRKITQTVEDCVELCQQQFKVTEKSLEELLSKTTELNTPARPSCVPPVPPGAVPRIQFASVGLADIGRGRHLAPPSGSFTPSGSFSVNTPVTMGTFLRTLPEEPSPELLPGMVPDDSDCESV